MFSQSWNVIYHVLECFIFLFVLCLYFLKILILRPVQRTAGCAASQLDDLRGLRVSSCWPCRCRSLSMSPRLLKLPSRVPHHSKISNFFGVSKCILIVSDSGKSEVFCICPTRVSTYCRFQSVYNELQMAAPVRRERSLCRS